MLLKKKTGVSHRPPTSHRRPSGGSPGPEHRSSLASLLLNLNTSAVSSISATIGGSARLAERGSDEEAYYRQQHLENNTFDQEVVPGAFHSQHQQHQQQDSNSTGDGQGCFVAGEEVRVVVVNIKDVRISDWKGQVRDWDIVPQDGSAPAINGAR